MENEKLFIDMTKRNPYSFFLLLFAQIFLLLSCSRDNNKQDHLVSTIISSDSVIMYSGKLESNTLVQKIGLNEKFFKEVLAEKKNKANKPITVLLKLSPDGGQGGIIGSVSNVIQWSKELGITSFLISDGEDKTIAEFNSAEDTWHYIDSGFSQPHTLNLNLPKDEEEPDTQVRTGNALTCLLFGNENIYCYQGSDFKQGKYYSIDGVNSFRKELLRVKKIKGDNLTVIIKPAKNTTYKSAVDILDEMTINKIKTYTVVKLSKAEESFLLKH